jgi:hypothetical protein
LASERQIISARPVERPAYAHPAQPPRTTDQASLSDSSIAGIENLPAQPLKIDAKIKIAKTPFIIMAINLNEISRYCKPYCG